MHHPDDSSFEATVAHAETMLASADNDARWQGAILLGELCESAPEAVWPAVVRWGSGADADIRAAIATCVLEHILEHHFDPFFDRARDVIRAGNSSFADTFRQCWRFGQSDLPSNRSRLDALLKEIEAKVG